MPTFNNTSYPAGYVGQDDDIGGSNVEIDNLSTSTIVLNGTITAVGQYVTYTGTLPNGIVTANNRLYYNGYDTAGKIQFIDAPTADTADNFFIFSNTPLMEGTQSDVYNNDPSASQYQPRCFATGTRIRTARGEVAVEALRVGDLAVTASGTLRPITWIGHRDLDGHGRTLLHDLQPVRIRAGAFGPRLPARDLRLSPGHPVLVGADEDGEGGHLVPVMCLINGTSITREPTAGITYWHVELDAHDILLAEGLPAESYLDGGDRAFFDEASDHALHNPDFVVPGLGNRCRPVAIEGTVVEAERARLDAVFAADLASHSAWDETAAWLAA